MASLSYKITNLLEKMTSNDKDFRFMATNDLMTELQKDSIKLDDDLERKVVKMLLKLLEDKNGEVQNLAVKCLGPLVNKVKDPQVESIVEVLCGNMLSDKEQLRDISSIGLKTVISELPLVSSVLPTDVCNKITEKLSSAIEKQSDVSVQLEALDILADLLSRFGTPMKAFHNLLLNTLLPQLASSRQAVRKRTIVALSHLVMSCTDKHYTKLISHLLEGLGPSSTLSVRRTHIQCIAAICRQAGHRFGPKLPQVEPYIFAHSEDPDEELREHLLQALEAFVLKCPKEVTPHIQKIILLCLKMMVYDPNYNYEGSESDGMCYEEDENGDTAMDDEDAPEDADSADSDEYSDDDDTSWKVRRAAAKCLESVISTRHEMLAEFYKTVSPALIDRFKEREENVKCDIFSAYIALLRATRPAANAIPNTFSTGDSALPEDSPLVLLQGQVGLIVRGLLPVLRGKSVKARQESLLLLRELLVARPTALAPHVPKLIPALQYSLSDKNSSSNMKIDTLVFIQWVVSGPCGVALRPHAAQLLPAILACVKDPFYKITAEALRVMQALVKVIRPLDEPVELTPELAAFTIPMYNCTKVRLCASDIDQEVKERAIAAMGQLLCHLGDQLQAELPVCLPIFLERLKNEITRLTTVKALTKVAASPLRIDLRMIMPDAVPILASFLRKNQRALKLSTLILLDTLVKNYSTAMSPELLNKVLIELPPLINESDLHIAQLTLGLMCSVCRAHPETMNDLHRTALPQVLTLARSPLLQGAALNSMLELFQALVKTGLPGLSHQELLQLLVAPVKQLGPHNALPHLHKQAFHSLAKCVSALTVETPVDALRVAQQFLQDARTPASDAHHMFALLGIAEIGRHIDLCPITNLKEILLSSFSPPSEEVKSAASYALGSVAVGNLQEFLPFILNEIQLTPKRQYLLLHSLKEIITSQSCSPAGVESLRPYILSIWQQLSVHCQCVEEGSRNVVAECLGKLCLLEPTILLPRLLEFLKNPLPLVRTTGVTAIKFTISDQPQAIDPLLRQCMGEFLSTLHDTDLGVRRVALVAFNSATHNKPSLIRDLLDDILPTLYQETKVKKELIREVEMGPFKHTVDDGLDLRKAAFECMYTLLGTCLDRLDVFQFLQHVEGGLKDHYDIKMLTYLMTARLAHLCPTVVLQRIDGLVAPLRTTCLTKVKANSVKQEYEKQDELKRSALRAGAALLQIPEADKNPHLTEFVTSIKAIPDLQAIFETILKDSSGTASVDPNVMDQS